MLEFEPQDVPNWYLGVLYNKEHLQELQWVFKNVWRRCKQDKTFDETFISSATWIFYWMKRRAVGEISHQVDIYQEILDKIGIHWCAKLKWCSQLCYCFWKFSFHCCFQMLDPKMHELTPISGTSTSVCCQRLRFNNLTSLRWVPKLENPNHEKP